MNVKSDRENVIPTTSGANAKAGRLASLDVFRGLTVAAMIVANNAGSGVAYPALRHAQWDGWTPTDLIFPWFLFIVGVSITFALSKRRDDPGGAAPRPVLGKIARRTLIIFGLGIALAGFPTYSNWATIRIPGVLQRIALCYAAASLIFLATRVRGQVLAIVGLLVGYWLVMTRVPVPSFGAGDLARGHDLASYLDRLLLPGHIYRPDYDPEGLLSTLPAVATTLIGVLAGHWLRSGRDRHEIDSGLFVAGTAVVVAGWAWGSSFPINKALWTSSFVLLTGGLALIGLATCYWVVDLRGIRRWSYPFRVLGVNPIAAYVLAAAGARLLNQPMLNRGEGGPITVHRFIHDGYLLPHLAPIDASLAYALLLLLACGLVVAILDALGLHLRA